MGTPRSAKPSIEQVRFLLAPPILEVTVRICPIPPIREYAMTKETFTLGSFTASGAKVLIKRYEAMGYKFVSSKYDTKKEMHYTTFKETAKTYVSDRVFEGKRPVKGKRLEAAKTKRSRKKK